MTSGLLLTIDTYFLNAKEVPMFDNAEQQAILDSFYFQHIIPKMHPTLQKLAVDSRVLRHAKIQRNITSLLDVYGSDYLLLPWILDDIFDVPETQRQLVAQGYIAMFIGYVLLDHLIDKQTPDSAVVPLIYQHIALSTTEQYSVLFEMDSPFWPHYYADMREIFNVLALESECIDTHTYPYSLNLMGMVAHGKAAAWHTACFALATLSQTSHHLIVVNNAYTALALADQLGDDAIDWEEDFAMRRATVPIVYVADIKGLSLHHVFDLPLHEIEDCLIQNRIQLTLIESALETLQTAVNSLAADGLANCKLSQLLRSRLEAEQHRRRNFLLLSFLHSFSKSLTG